MRAQFKGQTVLVGVDDLDVFKGIELKLLALEQVQPTAFLQTLLLARPLSGPGACLDSGSAPNGQ